MAPCRARDVACVRRACVAELLPGTIGELPSLELLYLEGNRIAIVDVGAFAGLPSLLELHCTSNEIAGPIPAAFWNNTRLHSLFLGDNLLNELRSGVLPVSLTELDVEDNCISDVAPGVLSGLPSLQELGLAGNAIRVLQPGAFAGLSELVALDLDSNLVESFDPAVLEGVTSLRFLTLGGNILTQLALSTSATPALYQLDLSFNAISGTMPDVCGFDALQVLTVAYNHISGTTPSCLLRADMVDQVLTSPTILCMGMCWSCCAHRALYYSA